MQILQLHHAVAAVTVAALPLGACTTPWQLPAAADARGAPTAAALTPIQGMQLGLAVWALRLAVHALCVDFGNTPRV
jgi:hypothetical protein